MKYLYYGDNFDVMRRYLETGSVDLVYLDPPFNSSADYSVLFSNEDGSRDAAQIKAFGDTWRWDEAAVDAYEAVDEAGGAPADLLSSLRSFLGSTNMMAYLSMMTPRLVELRRVLSDTGSIFLHCDPTASHYLKLVMDAVFGAKQFRNEIAWCYWGPSSPNQRQFSRKHDTILWYSVGDRWTFDADAVRIPYSDKTQANYKAGLGGSGFAGADRAIDEGGKIPEDWWPMAITARRGKEYLRYPTQKPEELLRRILLAASSPGDVVLDPFCGCGTTVSVAEELGREWVGIDITHLAVNLMKHRLKLRHGLVAGEHYQVVGEPTTLDGARALAEEDEDRHQFELWALGLVGARPEHKKKGRDEGIDGRLFFHERRGDPTRTVIISVKSGRPGVGDVHQLKSVVEREEAAMGVIITLRSPTQPERAEAASAGKWDSVWGRHPKIQILTVEELLDGARIDMPPPGTSTTYRGPKERYRRPMDEPGLFEQAAED